MMGTEMANTSMSMDSMENSSQLYSSGINVSHEAASPQYDDRDLYEYDPDYSTSMGSDSGEGMGQVVIQRVLLPIICACGIVGIILTVVVLSRKVMSTSTNCYLMALAIADLLFLLLLATTLADNQFIAHSKPFYSYVIYVTYATIFMHIFLLTSIWLTVMLAVERYIAICRPFLANKVCTMGKARIIIASIYLLAGLCRLPNFWENKIVTAYDTTNNSTLVYMEVTEFSVNELYTKIYPWLVDGVITSLLPFCLLLLLNVRLIWEVRKSTKYLQRNQMLTPKGGVTSVVQKEELQITVMLISVIMVFFVCQAPYVIYTAIVSIRQFAASSSGLMLFRYITMLLLTLKSAINFLLYCWFSEKFWTTLKRLFCLECCRLFHKNHEYLDNGSLYHARRISSLQSTRDTTI